MAADGSRSSPIPGDLADPAALDRAVDQVQQELGSVRVLVNAAATDVPAAVVD
jgi:NAD(P)-dependent dehydrogenase (short-subunit alcohol dehydrogenase family)